MILEFLKSFLPAIIQAPTRHFNVCVVLYYDEHANDSHIQSEFFLCSQLLQDIRAAGDPSLEFGLQLTAFHAIEALQLGF